MSENETLAVCLLGIVLPILILGIAVIYYEIRKEEQQEEKSASPKTGYCKLRKQFCDVDIILSRYECISIQEIDFFDYELFKKEINSVFDTIEEKKNFFKKYPFMRERYEKVNHVLSMML